MNVMRWADQNLKTLVDFDAFVSGDRVWSSRAVQGQAARMASGLLAMGVAPGDRVLLLLPTGTELVISCRAVLRAGGVVIVAHYDSPLQRIEQLVAEIQPAAIVTSAASFRLEASSALPHRIQIDAEEECPGWISFRRILADHRPLVEPVPRSGSDVASIQYTSGTTGKPKGIVTRHDALTAQLKSMQISFAPWRLPIRQLSMLPMSSSFGSRPVFEGLVQKCTYFLLDRFDPEEVLEAIQKHRIERMFLVPAMCEAILAVSNIRAYDVSSLSAVICGGAHVSAYLVDRFAKEFGVSMEVRYGMTGVGGVSRTSPNSKPGSVGRPYRHLRAKVVDPEGRALPAGEVGELMLRLRKETAVEYWNLGGFTAAASPEGWYRSGDLARFDEDGELYIVGRNDDLIIQGGHNIHGQTVADLVQRLPEVRECAVIGVPNTYLGQEAVVCVALRDGAQLTAREIIACCRDHLEARAVPASVQFVEALPRNEMGKVKNHELRTAIESGRDAEHETDLVRRLRASLASDRHNMLTEEIKTLLGQILSDSGISRVSAGSSFLDIGLDSLGAVELAHTLSDAVGHPLLPTLIYSYPTVEAVCDFLLELLGLPFIGNATSANRLAPPLVNPDELRLEAYLTPLDLDAARLSTPARDGQIVFLTGANGFLGRFLVLEILKGLPPEGRLYCLVRSLNRLSALERLRCVYGSEPSLQDYFDLQVKIGRLIVVEGDLRQPCFGLSEKKYARLCDEVDCIVHNGAVVDHVLAYGDLFPPNVLGTVEIIRFAVARRIKGINYVSTIAVRGMARKPLVLGNGALAVGYSTSKWASERLLKELHDLLKVPVRVYRPSHIMAHSKVPGQINVRDTFTRLLQGIVATSLAPRSFYGQGRSTEGAHYDGLPVDVVARSIAALSVAGGIDHPGHMEYHIVNSHRDVSLDVVTDWVKSAGYRVEQIDDYAAWYRAFKSRLNSLDRLKRQHSLLPLIHDWEQPRRGASARYDMTSLHQQLAQLSDAAGAERLTEIPPITEAFIHKCLSDMRMLGLIDTPG
jgi:thioester reductase-like protein